MDEVREIQRDLILDAPCAFYGIDYLKFIYRPELVFTPRVLPIDYYELIMENDHFVAFELDSQMFNYGIYYCVVWSLSQFRSGICFWSPREQELVGASPYGQLCTFTLPIFDEPIATDCYLTMSKLVDVIYKGLYHSGVEPSRHFHCDDAQMIALDDHSGYYEIIRYASRLLDLYCDFDCNYYADLHAGIEMTHLHRKCIEENYDYEGYEATALHQVLLCRSIAEMDPDDLEHIGICIVKYEDGLELIQECFLKCSIFIRLFNLNELDERTTVRLKCSDFYSALSGRMWQV